MKKKIRLGEQNKVILKKKEIIYPTTKIPIILDQL